MNNENKIFKIIKRIYRRACYSEKYGSHPGTGILIAMILMGAVAGASNESFNPAIGDIFGSAIMALWTVPIWLIGCYGPENENTEPNTIIKSLRRASNGNSKR